VIVVEAVMQALYVKNISGLTSKLSRVEMDDEVERTAGKMMSATVFGQIIILIVYLPILTLQGIEGKMFKPMAQTVGFAILGAFILSLTYVPMMASLVLSRKLQNKNFSDRAMEWLTDLYTQMLNRVLAFPKTVVFVTVFAFIISLFVLSNLGGEFIPKLEEGDFAVDTRVLTGSSLTTNIQTTQQAAKILLTRYPEVEKVVTKIGSGEIPIDPMPIEASDMMVILKDKEEWVSAKTFDELAEKMNVSLQDIPGITTGFQYPVQMRFNELMTGGRQDVVCKLFGENLDSLTKYAARIGEVVSTVEGAVDLYVETATGLEQIVIQYDRAALAQYNLSIENVNQTVQTAFAGMASGQVFENERRFDLVVRLEREGRKDLSDVRNLPLGTPQGIQVPLSVVANVEIKVGPNQIQRENAQRRITVGFNVRGRDVETIVEELKQKINYQLKFPAGYYVTYGGQFENLVEAKARLSIAVPIALLLILAMLYFAFSSLRQGLII